MYIEQTNLQYEARGRASIIKQNPEITVLNMRGKEITRAFWKTQGAPDYIGVGDGRAFIFDAKETTRKNFPLDKLHAHQFEKLRSWHLKGAVAFLIVYFTDREINEIFILPFDLLDEAWQGYLGDGAKSIPYKTFFEKCERVQPGGSYVLDYLSALKK